MPNPHTGSSLLSCGAGCYSLPVRSCLSLDEESTTNVEEVRDVAKSPTILGKPFALRSSGLDEALKDPSDADPVVDADEDKRRQKGSFSSERTSGTTQTTRDSFARSSGLASSTLSASWRYGGSMVSGAPGALDFGGSWICVRIAGDMETFLTDMGLSEVVRKTARDARYGVGRQVQNIAHAGDAFVIQNILQAPLTMRFRVGAGLQESVDQEGKPILIDPSWDGESLRVTSKRESGELIANTRRYFEGDSMVLELTSPQGTIVTRTFERR